MICRDEVFKPVVTRTAMKKECEIVKVLVKWPPIQIPLAHLNWCLAFQFAGAAVVWQGHVDDLKARDPRGSNTLYSALVGPRSSACASSASTVPGSPTTSPVGLTFRYTKETGEGSGDDAEQKLSPALRRSGGGPWESSALTLRFSESEVVYFQPLWLEVIDFAWEGLLGAAVWGGITDSSVETSSAPAEGRSASGESRVLRSTVDHGTRLQYPLSYRTGV